MKTVDDTLAHRINTGQELTVAEQDALMDLIGKGCHARTKRMLAAKLSYVPDIPCWSAYERVLITPYTQYFAGQDYRVEMAQLRKLLIG